MTACSQDGAAAEVGEGAADAGLGKSGAQKPKGIALGKTSEIEPGTMQGNLAVFGYLPRPSEGDVEKAAGKRPVRPGKTQKVRKPFADLHIFPVRVGIQARHLAVAVEAVQHGIKLHQLCVESIPHGTDNGIRSAYSKEFEPCPHDPGKRKLEYVWLGMSAGRLLRGG